MKGIEDLNISEECKEALELFTKEELNELRYFISSDDNTYMGIGFISSNGQATKYAEPEKAAAIELLEKELAKELVNSYNRLHIFVPEWYLK